MKNLSTKYDVQIINESHRNTLRANGIGLGETIDQEFKKYAKRGGLYKRFQERSEEGKVEESEKKLREKASAIKIEDGPVFKERKPIDMRLDTAVNVDKTSVDALQKKRDQKRANLRKKR